MAANSFPRDMDYRQEALQDKATTSIYGLLLNLVVCFIKSSSETFYLSSVDYKLDKYQTQYTCLMHIFTYKHDQIFC